MAKTTPDQTTPMRMTYIKFNHRKFLGFFNENYLYIVLAAIFILGVFQSDKFLRINNLMNVLLQNTSMISITMGMLMAIITGGIDLTVGSIIALSGCLVSGQIQNGADTIPAVMITLVFMSLIGAANGLFISYGKIPAFIVTLSMQTIVRGMAYVYQVGADRRIDGTPFVDFVNSYVADIPTPVIIMLIVFVSIWFLLCKTTFGRSVYAIGGNSETARLAGINVSRSIIIVYTMSAFLAGLAGIITAGRLSMGTAIVGTGAEMDAIAAVVVGGASLSGGKGSAVKALIGALIIAYLANLMNLLGVPPYPQMIIKGVIILLAVLINRGKN